MRDLYPSEKYTGYQTAYNSGPDDGSTPVYKFKKKLVEKQHSIPCVACPTYIFNCESNVGTLFSKEILNQNALQKYEMTD
jgi:hypothetical protein